MIIVDGKIPEDCGDCPYRGLDDNPVSCALTGGEISVFPYYGNKDPSCPILAEIPDDHGDLIDKQSLIRGIETIDSGDEHTILRAKWMVRTAPTVLGRSDKE